MMAAFFYFQTRLETCTFFSLPGKRSIPFRLAVLLMSWILISEKNCIVESINMFSLYLKH